MGHPLATSYRRREEVFTRQRLMECALNKQVAEADFWRALSVTGFCRGHDTAYRVKRTTPD